MAGANGMSSKSGPTKASAQIPAPNWSAADSKWDRVAKQRAQYAEYEKAGGKLSMVEFMSAQQTQRAAATPSPREAPRTTARAVAQIRKPALPVVIDREWGGGDRDSDDVYRRYPHKRKVVRG